MNTPQIIFYIIIDSFCLQPPLTFQLVHRLKDFQKHFRIFVSWEERSSSKVSIETKKFQQISQKNCTWDEFAMFICILQFFKTVFLRSVDNFLKFSMGHFQTLLFSAFLRRYKYDEKKSFLHLRILRLFGIKWWWNICNFRFHWWNHLLF